MRRAAHRDKAEPDIIKALRKVGASVQPLSGKDVPDLLVGYRGVTYLLEVKSELQNTKKDGYTRRTRTPLSNGQAEWHAAWRGGPVAVVETPEAALRVIGLEPPAPRWWTEEDRAELLPPPKMAPQHMPEGTCTKTECRCPPNPATTTPPKKRG